MTSYMVNIPVSGANIPADLIGIDLIISVAGRQFSQSLPAAPNQIYPFIWDGMDAYGRPVQGTQPLTVQIGYVYPLVYLTALPFNWGTGYNDMFGHFSYYGTPVTTSMADRQITLWQTEQLSIGGFIYNAISQGLGGWDLDIHHVYDPVGKVLYLGDGSWRSADALNMIITTVAGNGNYGYSGDGGPATIASLYDPQGVAVGPDGSIYIADAENFRIRRVGPDGIITTVAGNGTQGHSGDGGPATSASLNFPWSVAVGPDGSIYIAEADIGFIRRVGPDGIITTVAGNGNYGYSGDGGPATIASLYDPQGVAVGPDGSIYIADAENFRIRRVGPDGIITTVAGGKSTSYPDYAPLGDGGPATSASLYDPQGVAVGPDGSIYIADTDNYRIRRVGPDGIITTVAGNGISSYGGDGGPATSASLNFPWSVAVGSDGSIYIADTINYRIRRVVPDGIITTVAGNGNQGYGGDGGPATSALINLPFGVAVGPDGNFYIADMPNYRIRRAVPSWPGVSISEIPIPSEDGSQLYIFNGSGQHQSTVNALTGATLFSFSYDSGGRLNTVTDGAGNITTIARDSSGNPTAIVAPFGQQTALTVDANGYLASMTDPAGESTLMSYDNGGLMTTYTDPKGNMHNFSYDANGFLVLDANPAGGYTALSGTSTAASKQEVVTTALGRISTYLTEYLTTNAQRQTNTTHRRPECDVDKYRRQCPEQYS